MVLGVYRSVVQGFGSELWYWVVVQDCGTGYRVVVQGCFTVLWYMAVVEGWYRLVIQTCRGAGTHTFTEIN